MSKIKHTTPQVQSPKERLISIIINNIKSSFRDADNSIYVILNDDSVMLLESESTTLAIMKQVIQSHLFKHVDSQFVRNCLHDYIKSTTDNDVKVKVWNHVAVLMERYEISSLFIKMNKSDVIKLSPNHYEIVKSSDVSNQICFIQTTSMLDMPKPESGHNIDSLKEFINYGNDDDTFKLILVWIIYSFFPGKCGAKVALVLQGEQGSGKSKTAQILKQLINPSKYPLMSFENEEDFILKTKNEWLLVLDNESGFNRKTSNMLCKMLTGGSLSKRKLFTDSDLCRISFKTPLIINSLDSIIKHSDLADRCVIIKLPRLQTRLDEQLLDMKFEESHSKIFGAILDILSKVIAILPNVSHNYPQRMANFVRVGVAVEKAYGWKDGTFIKIYNHNIKDVVYDSIETNVLLDAIVKLVEHKNIEGEPTHVYNELRTYFNHDAIFPPNVISFGKQFDKLIPQLRKIDIEVQRKRGIHRRISISKAEK